MDAARMVVRGAVAARSIEGVRMATFTGGGKLKTKLQEFISNLTGGDVVRIGFLENATYPSGKSVAMIAAIQDFGAPGAGIPPRPFFRNMIAAKKSEWGPAMGQLLIDNNYNAVRALELTGEAVAGQLRQSIIDTNEPPLAASTLRKRGVAAGTKYDPANPATYGAKPLVDTGHMLNSVNYEVKTT